MAESALAIPLGLFDTAYRGQTTYRGGKQIRLRLMDGRASKPRGYGEARYEEHQRIHRRGAQSHPGSSVRTFEILKAGRNRRLSED